MRLIDADKLIEAFKNDFGDNELYRKYAISLVEACVKLNKVKAIPVEYIKEFIEKHSYSYKLYETTNEDDFHAYAALDFAYAKRLLEDWEKENGN